MSAVTLPPTGLSRPAPTFTERWRRLPGWSRILLSVVALALVVQIAGSFVGGVTGSGNNVSGTASSYDTSAVGTAALAQLLSDRGQSVSRVAVPLSPASVARATTLFTLDPVRWTSSATRAVAHLLALGQTVIVSGPVADRAALDEVGLGTLVTWQHRVVGLATARGTSTFVRGVTTLFSPGAGSLRVSGTLPRSDQILAEGQSGTLALAIHQTGWLIVLASSSPLQNHSLASTDNAAFGLNLAQPRSPSVTFDEYIHGFGSGASGLAGLPAPWRFGLGTILVALGIWIYSASRRLGPPQHADRDLIPPRIRYVDAVATLLGSKDATQRADAVAPVTAEVRATLVRRFALAPDATDDSLRRAARDSVGREREYAELVAIATTSPRTPDEVLAVGHALSLLRRDTVDVKEIHD